MAIERAAFVRGLMRLAVASRQPMDDITIEVYFEALADELDAAVWDAFTRRAAKSGELRNERGEIWIPKLADLRELYLHEAAVRSGRMLPAADRQGISPAVLAALPAEARDAYLSQSGHHCGDGPFPRDVARASVAKVREKCDLELPECPVREMS